MVSPSERYDSFGPYAMMNAFGVLECKAESERYLREQSGLPYTIVRPCRLTDGPYTSYDLNTLLGGVAGNRQEVVLKQGDSLDGEVSRIAVAECLVQCLTHAETSGAVTNESKLAAELSPHTLTVRMQLPSWGTTWWSRATASCTRWCASSPVRW